MTSTSFPSSRVVFFRGRHDLVDVRNESFARYSEDSREAKKVREKEFIYVRCISPLFSCMAVVTLMIWLRYQDLYLESCSEMIYGGGFYQR